MPRLRCAFLDFDGHEDYGAAARARGLSLRTGSFSTDFAFFPRINSPPSARPRNLNDRNRLRPTRTIASIGGPRRVSNRRESMTNRSVPFEREQTSRTPRNCEQKVRDILGISRTARSTRTSLPGDRLQPRTVRSSSDRILGRARPPRDDTIRRCSDKHLRFADRSNAAGRRFIPFESRTRTDWHVSRRTGRLRGIQSAGPSQ